MDESESSATSLHADQAVKDFAEAFSMQSRLANRIWLALFGLVFVSIQVENKDESSGVTLKQLPFALGNVEASHFASIYIFLICALSIQFFSALAQSQVAYQFAHDSIDLIPDRARQRVFFNILTNPTLARVGPLGEKLADGGKLVKYSSAKMDRLVYSILRALSGIVFLGLPVICVLQGWLTMISANVGIVVLVCGTVFGAMSLVAFQRVVPSYAKNIKDVLVVLKSRANTD